MSVSEKTRAADGVGVRHQEESREPWAHKWGAPPPDVPIPTSPPGARARAAAEVAGHVRAELFLGRSLYSIVHDEFVLERIGGPDGRALTGSCLRSRGL
ncbi:MAG: hypothetical protein U0R71_14430 [Solirubrobacterales bacterium]